MANDKDAQNCLSSNELKCPERAKITIIIIIIIIIIKTKKY
jgi:hypothetical protein